MKELFQYILEASIYGSIIILAVLLLRLLLRKAPKRFSCILWLLVGLRLLIPLNIESRISLQPDVTRFSQVQEQQSVQRPQTPEYEIPENAGKVENWEVPDVKPAPEAKPETGAKPAPEVQQNPVSPVEPEAESSVAAPKKSVNFLAVAGMVWILIAVAFVIFNMVSYLKLKRQVRGAVKVPGGWASDKIETAFILGYVKPQIYVPMSMDPHDRSFIMRHERAHLDKGDHWYKLVGFLVLSVHWFNPLVWVAYILLCRDIEMACDERVIRNMELADRKRYSAALLSCSTNHAHLAACPVAFAEVSVKTRIQSVLKYKKPRFWISVAAVVALVFVLVCFLTNPISEKHADEETLATEPTMEQPEISNNPVLSESELVNYFQQLLSWRDNEPWYYNSMNTNFSSPKEISFPDVFGSGIGGKYELTDEEKKYLINQSWPEEAIENIDVVCIPADKMNEVLNRYFGISLADTDRNYLDWFDYVPETDCYYMMHRRTGSDREFVVVKVVVSSNEYDVYYYNGHSYRRMRLRLEDGIYQIASDQEAEESVDIPHLVKDSCLTVFDYLPSGESVSTTGLVRTGFEKEINGVKISLPEIILDSEFARAFNSEMQEFGADAVYWVTNHNRDEVCYYAYEYDNVLSILVTHHVTEFGFQEYMLYNFNLETGESMTAEDMRERFLGISRLEYLLLTGMAKYAIGHNTQIINDRHIIPPNYMSYTCWSQDYNFEGFDLMVGRNGMPVLVTNMEGNRQGGVIVSVEIASDVLAYFSGNSETAEPTEEPIEETTAEAPQEPTETPAISAPLEENSVSETDLVRTGIEETFKFNENGYSDTITVSLPEIVYNADFADAYNDRIDEYREQIINKIKADGGKAGADSIEKVSYEAYSDGKVLSILIKTEYANGCVGYTVDNIRIKTGEHLSADDMREQYLNISYPAFLEYSIILREKEFENVFGKEAKKNAPELYDDVYSLIGEDPRTFQNMELMLGKNGQILLVCNLPGMSDADVFAQIPFVLLDKILLPNDGEAYNWLIDFIHFKYESYPMECGLLLKRAVELDGKGFSEMLEQLSNRYDKKMVEQFAGYLLEAYEGQEDTLEKLTKKLPNGRLKDALLDALTPKQDAENQEAQKQDYQSAPGEADGYVHSYPLGTTVRYDLNGDGVGEDITVLVTGENGDKAGLTINGITIKDGGDYEYYTVIRPDASKNTLLVGISKHGSGDYWTELYAYDGKEISKVGRFYDIVGEGNWDAGAVFHGDGTLTARSGNFDVLGTWRGWGRYAIDENSVRNITVFYSLDPWEENQLGWMVTNKVDLIMYKDRNDPSTMVTIPAGTKLCMIGCTSPADNAPWVAFEFGSAGIFWLQVYTDVGWQTAVKIDSGYIRSEEAFDGFWYAG